MSAGGEGVELWLAREAAWCEPARQAWLEACLTEQDLARVQRMRAPAGRLQQLITRALARHALSHYLPSMSPRDWRFSLGAHGRPQVASDLGDAARAVHFNIAHTAGLVVMAVGSRPELGVDVEKIGERAPLAVARRHFSAREIADLDALPEAERPARFIRLWTLKEAWLKALGTGIAGGLDRMSFRFEREELRIDSADAGEAGQWAFREFEVDGEYRVALACRLEESDGPLAVRRRDFSAAESSGQEQRAQAEQSGEADAVREGGEDHAG